ncbi:hypothetical protein [Aeromonas veronii]|uniref:hypothetical protein n=1 Tax=Aeromonas veronii TaxID=654 RepID=UPI003D248E03
MNAIEITGNNEFTVKARGMTLVCKPHDGEWLVLVNNASARAWNRGRAAFKVFASLEAVEKHYKSFAGLVDMVKALEVAQPVEAPKASQKATETKAATVAPVSTVDAVKAIAKRHGMHCRQLRLKRGVMSLGRQLEWLKPATFQALLQDLSEVKGIRIIQLDILTDSARHYIKEDRIMVDTLNLELIN